MENKFVQQLKRGILDMVVLKLIMKEATYGYEIIQKLEQSGGPSFKLKDGTLYPVLYRLEDSGYIRSAWHTNEGRATPKKYYSITPEGEKKYQEYWDSWNEFNKSVKMICGEEDVYDVRAEED